MSTADHNSPIPSSRPAKRFLSLPALGFILASLLLASVLAIVTWHNLDREEQFMEGFLLKQAETLIRAFEAGARTSMMMGSRGGNLETLVTETAREETIAYILIQDEKGHPVANAGKLSRVTVATNMAGRGTDIKLCPLAIQQGGLHVIATEYALSARIDRQLVGRAARHAAYELAIDLDEVGWQVLQLRE